jgi:chemotaxis protein CheX
MDVKYINPVLHAMLNVLGTMAGLEAKAGKPQIKQDNRASGDVTGILSMKGRDISGSIAISFSRPVILTLVNKMLHMEFDEINDMVCDLAGEIANMVTGGAKANFEQLGYGIDMSLPTVIKGQGTVVEHKHDTPVVILPFTTEAGEFVVEMCFQD